MFLVVPRTCTLVFSRRFLAWSKSRRLERNLFTPVNSIENLKILWNQSYKALHKCSINYRILIAAKFWWYCPQVFWFNNINFGDIILLHFPLQLGGNRRPNYLLVGMNSNLVGTNCLYLPNMIARHVFLSLCVSACRVRTQ